MKVIGILPARYGSTRFPGKPLITLLGKPMIQWTYEAAQRTATLDEVWAAVDDSRIYDAVKRFGGNAVMTSPAHQSGTERIREAMDSLAADVYVNIQADEPAVEPAVIDSTVKSLTDHDADWGTVARPVSSEQEWRNPNRVKVVLDTKGFALYFSRSTIPYFRNSSDDSMTNKNAPLIHLGIYAYTHDALLRFTKLNPSPLEGVEKLEQLRALENGMRIHVARVEEQSAGVDVPEDVKIVEEILRRRSVI